MKKILLIAGTRPNFIKLAPLYHTLKNVVGYEVLICHTGQHFDSAMSDVFWKLLKLPLPNFMLNCSGGSSSEITGKTIVALSELFNEHIFSLVVVFGDVNATLSGAIVSTHNRVKLMHVEAGLRSYDRNMPEEVNRVITDHVSDYLMVSEPSGLINLEKEGIASEKLFFVGNIMIETLINSRKDWDAIDISAFTKDGRPFIVATFHRPENVDVEDNIQQLIYHLNKLSEKYNIIFPIHPRTKKRLLEFGLLGELTNNPSVVTTEPLDYFTFLKLISQSTGVITDSGGIQEETTYLRIPCITVRNNTERPITITEGTNVLYSINDPELYRKVIDYIQTKLVEVHAPIQFWDELVSNRIVKVIQQKI